MVYLHCHCGRYQLSFAGPFRRFSNHPRLSKPQTDQQNLQLFEDIQPNVERFSLNITFAHTIFRFEHFLLLSLLDRARKLTHAFFLTMFQVHCIEKCCYTFVEIFFMLTEIGFQIDARLILI